MTDDSNEQPPSGEPSGRERDDTEPIRERPSDVEAGRQEPVRSVAYESGETIAGRFEVRSYLGSSSAATSYLCHDEQDDAERVVKMLAVEISDEAFPEVRELARRASRVDHPGVGRVVGVGRTDEGRVFAAADYVAGTPLAKALAGARESEQGVDPDAGLILADELVEALGAIHDELAHGVLTPYNVYISTNGRPIVANLAFGRIAARELREEGEGPYVDSFYVAPEVAVDPDAVSRQADVYSLGMLVGELLAEEALPGDRESAIERAVDAARSCDDSVGRAVERALSFEPGDRPETPGEFRAPFETLCSTAGHDRQSPPAIGDQSLEFVADDVSPPPGGPGTQTTEERFVIRRNGLDYGPFTKDEVVEQLYDGDVDEETEVRDRVENESAPIAELDLFEEELEEFLDWRQEREIERAERRAQIKRRVETGGRAALTVAVVAAGAVFGVLLYFYLTRPAPEPLPLAKAVVQLDYQFEPPPEEFQRVDVDRQKLAEIFETGGAGPDSAGESGSGSGTAEPAGKGAEPETSVVDMSASGGSGKADRLTDREINEIIMSEFDELRECIQKELRENPSFTGTAIHFYIRPSGTTGGVRLEKSGLRDEPVGQCLVREFETMKFPPHSGVSNRGMTFPLKIESK